jgi:hypothetical protein
MPEQRGSLPPLPSGIWRHYKGPLYLVLGYGHDANDEQRPVVVYVGLQLDQARPGPRLAVRTATDFHAVVHDDGQTCSTPEQCARQDGGLRQYDREHRRRSRAT